MKKTFIKEGVLTFLATILGVVSSFGQTTITTGVLSPTSVCAGGNVSVPFTTTGVVAPLTTYSAQLSDATGAFTTPVEVGNAAATPITATIPNGTAAGAGYKIRVVSMLTLLPVTTGSESAALTVNTLPGAPAAPASVSYVQGATAVPLTSPGTGLLWYGDATGGTGNATAPTPSTATVGTVSYYVSQTVTGCEGPRAKIDVIVSACTPPAAPAAPTPVSYIQGAAAVPLTSPGTGLLWYTDATGGTGNAAAPTPSTGTVGTISYYVSQTVGGCESPRAKIDVVVSACTPPAAPAAPSPVTYIVGATAVPLTSPGTGLLWYAAATGGPGSATAPTPSTAAAGTTSYYVSQTVGGCESPRAKIDVVVSACTPPAAPTVTSPVSYIIGATATSLSATGSGNFLWYNASTGGVGNATSPTPSTSAAGTTSYYVSQTVSGCESARAQIDVVVSACTPPASPTVTSPVSYVTGATATQLSAAGPGTKLWYTAATGGAGDPTAPTPSTATVGTSSYWVSQTVSGCESARSKIDVVISACTPPALPTVTSPVSYVIGATATQLSATGPGTKLWYNASTGGTGSPTAPTPSTGSAGTTSYYVSQTVSGCESARAKIDVVVSACTPPAIPGVSNVAYCTGQTAAKLTATGTGLKWYDDAIGGTGNATAPTPSTASVGTKSYYVSQTVGGCESARAKIDVAVSGTPATPIISQPAAVCQGTTVPVGVITGSVQSTDASMLKWYTAASGGTGSATPAAPVTTASGDIVYYVSQSSASCGESARAKITLTVKPAPAGPTVAAIAAVCQNSSTPSSVLSNAVTGAGTKTWYTDLNGGSGSASAPTPNTAASGTKDYYVTQTVNGCESAPRTKVSIEVKPLPAAPTVAPVEYCKDVTTATALTATATGTLKWYNANGTVLASAPKPSTATVGDVSYFVTQTVAACEGPKAEIKVTTNPLPGSATVTNEAICQERGDKNYPFTATGSAGSSFNWYNVASGGTKEPGVPSVNLKNAGETTFYVTQVSAKGCESAARVAKKIRVKKLPGQPTNLPAPEYCQFLPAVALTATFETGATPNWYGTDASGGTASGSAPTPSTQEGGTTSFYVSQTLEACEGDRAKIDVLIKTTPKPSTTTALAYCQNENAPVLSATGDNLKWYRNATAAESQTSPFTPFTQKVEDYSFYVTQTGGNGCESPKEEIKIHIKALPSATISGNTSIGLGETAKIKITFSSDGPWDYVLSNGVTGKSDNNVVEVAVTPSTTTTYVITEVSNACGKGIPIGSALVTVRIPTVNSGNPSVAEVCAGKTFQVPFQQSGTFPADNKFVLQISTVNEDSKFFTIPSTATSSQITATIPDTTVGGSYFIRVMSMGTKPEFTVKGSVAGINLTVNPLPVGTISGSKTILIGENADLKVEFIGKAPWTFKLNDGAKDSSITASVNPYVFLMKPRVTTIYTINTITNGCGTVKTGEGSARIQVDPILGVEPPVVSFVKVYPTIVDGQCIIEMDELVSPKQSAMELIDLNGRTLMGKNIRQKITEVDLSNYPGGLYLIKVQNGNHTSVHRVMKK